jgi:hypothetical protein
MVYRHSSSGTIDHLVTQAEGRPNYFFGGHVLSCKKCNQGRNNVDLEEKKQMREGFIRLTFAADSL